MYLIAKYFMGGWFWNMCYPILPCYHPLVLLSNAVVFFCAWWKKFSMSWLTQGIPMYLHWSWPFWSIWYASGKHPPMCKSHQSFPNARQWPFLESCWDDLVPKQPWRHRQREKRHRIWPCYPCTMKKKNGDEEPQVPWNVPLVIATRQRPIHRRCHSEGWQRLGKKRPRGRKASKRISKTSWWRGLSDFWKSCYSKKSFFLTRWEGLSSETRRQHGRCRGDLVHGKPPPKTKHVSDLDLYCTL